MLEAGSGIGQAKPEIRPRVDENHSRRRTLANQVKRGEGSTYSSTDDRDRRDWVIPCRHDSTLERSREQRNSQILMPYKQPPEIERRSSPLIRHHFYSLDTAGRVDQN